MDSALKQPMRPMRPMPRDVPCCLAAPDALLPLLPCCPCCPAAPAALLHCFPCCLAPLLPCPALLPLFITAYSFEI